MGLETWWCYLVAAILPMLWVVSSSSSSSSWPWQRWGWRWRWRKSEKSAAVVVVLPPGPFPFPIVGNLPQLVMAGSSRHRYLTKLARKYGSIFSLRLGSSPAIVVSSPVLARELLHTHDKTFASRPSFGSAKLLMGDISGHKTVTFLPYGDEWKRTRKLYSLQLFTSRRIGEFQSEIIAQEIRELVHTRLDLAREAVDLSACIEMLVENIICRIVLRQRPSQVFSSSSSSSSTTTRSCSQINLVDLTRQLQKLYPTPLIGDSVPFLGFMDYKSKESMRKWKCSFDALMGHIIAEREKDPVPAKECVRDILDVFLLPDNQLDRDLVKVLIMELFTAGIVTSSAAIDWAMSELLANPPVLRKLQAELNVVVGRDRDVETSDIPQLPYLGAVLKETFRKHPPAALLVPHMSIDKCKVGGYDIPKGTTVFVNAWAMGHDPNVWKDEEKFIPERFLVGHHNSMDHVTWKGQHFELLPFGSGRRMCPGMTLAMSMVELTVSSLVHAFDKWELVLPVGHDSLDMSDECGLTCHRVNPLLALPRRAQSRLNCETSTLT